MSAQTIDILKISALVFFNLFCIFGIFVSIALLFAVGFVRKQIKLISEKTQETIDKSKEVLQTVQDTAVDAGIKVAQDGVGALAMLTPLIGIFGNRKSKQKSKTGIFQAILGRFM